MRAINIEKLKRLRVQLHLNTEYLAKLLDITEAEYLLIENNQTPLTKTQLDIICKLYGVSENYLLSEDVQSNAVHARTENCLSQKDEKQIAEFFNFQKYLGKKSSEELVLR
ncbi:helix-turn-helix domain-containing protein [Bacillaceae bacterium OS4b]|nr:helix-turn-helix domain-containing protein [Bacillaceae bacterium OS4b]